MITTKTRDPVKGVTNKVEHGELNINMKVSIPNRHLFALSLIGLVFVGFGLWAISQ